MLPPITSLTAHPVPTVSKTPTREDVLSLEVSQTTLNSSISHPGINDAFDRYKNLCAKFASQKESLLSKKDIPLKDYEEFQKLHKEIEEVCDEILALELSLADHVHESRVGPIADRVQSVSSTVMSSSSGVSSSSTTSRVSFLAPISEGNEVRTELITEFGGPAFEVITSAPPPSPVHAGVRRDSSRSTALRSPVVKGNSGSGIRDERKECKESFGDIKAVRFADNISRSFILSDTDVQREIRNCNECIISEDDLKDCPEKIQVRLREFNQKIKALREDFQMILAVGPKSFSFSDLELLKAQFTTLATQQKDYIDSVFTKEIVLEVLTKKKQSISTEVASSISKANIDKLEAIEKAVQQAPEVLDENIFVEGARGFVKTYNQQLLSLLKEASFAITNVGKLSTTNIAQMVDVVGKLKKYRDGLTHLFPSKSNIISATLSDDVVSDNLVVEQQTPAASTKPSPSKKITASASAASSPKLTEDDKNRYLSDIYRLQARIAQEMDLSFFKDEHHGRVKDYNAYRLQVIGALEFVRSRVNQLENNHISLRIKNMELFIKDLEQKNRCLYELLLS